MSDWFSGFTLGIPVGVLLVVAWAVALVRSDQRRGVVHPEYRAGYRAAVLDLQEGDDDESIDAAFRVHIGGPR